MKNNQKLFDVVCDIISSSNGENVSFLSACHEAGADEGRMENLVYENFGMSGQKFVMEMTAGRRWQEDALSGGGKS